MTTPAFTPYPTGRLKATKSVSFKTFEHYTTKPLGTPPPTWEVPFQHEEVDSHYPMDCNDVEGDCTIAGVDHLNRGVSGLFKETVAPFPTDAQIKTEYRLQTGGPDTGLNEESVLKKWHDVGIFGTKIEAFAPVSTTNLLLQHQAISSYGGLYLGIQCPESAQRAFQEEQQTGKVVPWIFEGEETEDGHCVVALGYGPHGGLHCATWGGIAVLTPSFLAHYLDEAWVVLTQQLVAAKKNTLGIDLETLKEDIASI